MTRDILGLIFTLVAAIEPDRSPSGDILAFLPQSRYRNEHGLRLNPHGQGPFCRFRIPRTFWLWGVYTITADGQVVYIGKCQNRSDRFGERGYGTIHPRNCFENGQSTNCKVNHLILEAAKDGCQVELWFHASTSPKEIEDYLVSELKPPWNSHRTGPKSRGSTISTGTDSKTTPWHERSQLPVKPEAAMPMFRLTLHQTYYRQGFFNVPVDFDRFVRPTEGPVALVLGHSDARLEGKINRRANRNGTPRIMGGAKLRDWFQSNHEIGDIIDVDLSSMDSIRIG